MNIRPKDGRISTWSPKPPTQELEDSPAIRNTVAKDDPEIIPGQDTDWDPFQRGSRKPSGPFGQATPGGSST